MNCRINTNVLALNIYHHVERNYSALHKSSERLSSGLRINRAADDPAGFAVSEKMRTQVLGLSQAEQNIQDAISMVHVADDGMELITETLQKLRQLAIQASTDTYTRDDRKKIQLEVGQLLAEIDRLASSVEFNNISLLNRGLPAGVKPRGEIEGPRDIVWVIDGSASMGPYQTSLATNAEVFANTLRDSGVDYRLAVVGFVDSNVWASGGWTTDTATFKSNVTAVGPTGSVEEGMTALQWTLNNLTFRSDAKKIFILLTDEDADDQHKRVETIDMMINNDVAVYGVINYPEGHGESTDEYWKECHGVIPKTEGEWVDIDEDWNYILELIAGSIVGSLKKGIQIQVGANRGDKIRLTLPIKATTPALKIANLDVTTRQNAERAIGTLDQAIGRMIRARSRVGAEENRLKSAFESAQIMRENQMNAESRIKDADFAAEAMKFTQNQILIQSGLAMLTQTNTYPQMVLQLLS